MTEPTTGSTVPRRQLGRYLREARGRAQMTVRAAATALEWSEPKIWRIESGQVSLRTHDVSLMCQIYGVPDDVAEGLRGLSKETKTRGWWHAYGDMIPTGFDVYIGLETAAASMKWYESELVPGQLQTDDYTATLIRSTEPDVSEDEIDRRVALRMARQALLTRSVAPPTVVVALGEAALRRPVGGRATMVKQLWRLAAACEMPNITLRVVPFETGMHYGLSTGPFVCLRFPTNGDGKEIEPPVIYVEGFTGSLYLDKPHEIARYDLAFDRILDAADDETGTKSRDLIAQAAKEFDR